MTHPPVELAPRAERQLPAGFTSFELTATYDHLMDAFVNQGVLLEVHSTDQASAQARDGGGERERWGVVVVSVCVCVCLRMVEKGSAGVLLSLCVCVSACALLFCLDISGYPPVQV